MTAEEYQDHDSESVERKRRASALSGFVLLAALALLVWLIWTFAQRPASVVEEPAPGEVETSVVVPDVIGAGEDDAVRRLQDAGLSVELETSVDVVATPGTVASQEPAAGDTVSAGSVVVIAVVDDSADTPYEPDDDSDTEAAQTDSSKSSGKPAAVGTTSVPKLVGLSESAAIRRIRAAGLDPKVMKQPRIDSVGKVYEQDPASGTRVPKGRKVFVLVGTDD